MKKACLKAGHCWYGKRGDYAGPMCYEPMGPARNGTNDQLANNLAQNAVVQPVLGCIGKAMPPETDAGGAQGTSNLCLHV